MFFMEVLFMGYVTFMFYLCVLLLVIVLLVPWCFVWFCWVKFYSCFVVQFLFVLYVGLYVNFPVSRWVYGSLCFVIPIICYRLVKYSCTQQCILVLVKFCASSRGYTLEAFERVWMGAENLVPTRVSSLDCPVRSKSLYQLSYTGPQLPALSKK
jgi:hypothetical protein